MDTSRFLIHKGEGGRVERRDPSGLTPTKKNAILAVLCGLILQYNEVCVVCVGAGWLFFSK